MAAAAAVADERGAVTRREAEALGAGGAGGGGGDTEAEAEADGESSMILLARFGGMLWR